MPLSVDDKLGPYEILALIGKGGMGDIYQLGADSVETSTPRERFTLPEFDNGLDAPNDVAPTASGSWCAQHAASDGGRRLAGTTEPRSRGWMNEDKRGLHLRLPPLGVELVAAIVVSAAGSNASCRFRYYNLKYNGLH